MITTAQYHRLELHVADSNLEVVRRARRMIVSYHRRDRTKRDARHAFYRAAIAKHAEARDLFRFVTEGA